MQPVASCIHSCTSGFRSKNMECSATVHALVIQPVGEKSSVGLGAPMIDLYLSQILNHLAHNVMSFISELCKKPKLFFPLSRLPMRCAGMVQPNLCRKDWGCSAAFSDSGSCPEVKTGNGLSTVFVCLELIIPRKINVVKISNCRRRNQCAVSGAKLIQILFW